jgi:acetyl-CoA carboxylase biotin carboxyl carrier protein
MASPPQTEGQRMQSQRTGKAPTESGHPHDSLSPLTDEDVRQIAHLVDALDRSSLDFLELELGDLKLTIGKGEAPAPDVSAVATSRLPAAAAPTAAPTAAGAVQSPPPPQSAAAAAQEGTVAIVAPIMGRFYAKPDPGAAPFVTVGNRVDEDTTVALIEVMKVFNAVPAGVCGIVTEVCVLDTQIVEFEQVMFRVRPERA